MSRRNACFLIIGVVMLLGLTACGDHSSPANNSTTGSLKATESVTLSFWWWGTNDVPGMPDWIDWVTNAYEIANPNVTIVSEERTGADIVMAFEAAAAVGEGPDIAPQWTGIFVLSQVWEGNVAPLGKFIDRDELSHWINTAENKFDNQIWAAPLYIVGLPLAYNKKLLAKAGLDPENPFSTWDEFLSACQALLDAGIMPLAGGNRSGVEGAWWFAHLAKQYMNSPADLQRACVGKGDFSDFQPWAEQFEELFSRGFFNKDFNSLEMQEKYDLFNTGEVAMVLSIDGAVLESANQLGKDTIGLTLVPPADGTGAMADFYTSTQSVSYYVTNWSPNKKVAADFIRFWHTPEAVQQWFDLTGIMPADNRFDLSQVDDGLIKKMLSLNRMPSVWLSNFIPSQIYEQADRAGGQLISTGMGTPSEVTARWRQSSAMWREQKPEEATNFRRWAGLE